MDEQTNEEDINDEEIPDDSILQDTTGTLKVAGHKKYQINEENESFTS